IDRNGKIVVAGEAHNPGDFALERYNPDGSLDTTFNGSGTLITDFGSNDGAYSVAIDCQGRIVVSGNSGADFALARYNANGTLDTTFNGTGMLTTDFGSGGVADKVAIDGHGKIVALGAALPDGATDFAFALARYNEDGILDSSFDGDGKVTTDFG